MDNLDKATTYGDFRNDVQAEQDLSDIGQYKIVAWNGKERVPLVLDGIDHEKKVIVLTTEPLTPYSDVSPDYNSSARSQRAELLRRYNVDERTHIESLHDSVEYMNDVLARGPLDDYRWCY